MEQAVQFHRQAVLELFQGAWQTAYIATPRLDAVAVALLMPYLRRPGVQIRVLTSLHVEALAADDVSLHGLQSLRSLPGCEVRELPNLTTGLYATSPDGPALVTGVALRIAELESEAAYGVWSTDGTGALHNLDQWWAMARRLDEHDWAELTVQTAMRQEARTVGDQIAKVGAFVRLHVFGTRRSRRLDPREFGAELGDWGRAVRPVEVALYKLDEVIRAREELETILADNGVEWNGHYLVPRYFLERDWPRIYSNRMKQLRERLHSPEGKRALKEQLTQARQELEGFFGELYPRVETADMDALTWINMQTTRVLTETVSSTILEDSGLEYRVLSIYPEDRRSVEEMQALLDDTKFTSVQLTFPWT